MAREVQVWVRCDRCTEKFDAEKGDQPIKESVPLVLGRDQVELDLCDNCVEELENYLATLFASGRRTRPAPKVKKVRAEAATIGRRCPECEAEGVTRVIETPQGFAVHRFRAHGVPGETKPRNRKKATA